MTVNNLIDLINDMMTLEYNYLLIKTPAFELSVHFLKLHSQSL